ncbi:MAG: hypothetical protein WCE58_05225 [Gallionella sp.]
MFRNKLLNLFLAGLAIFILSVCLIEYFPNGIFEDDAYFYFQIAKNILDLHRSTFDGISTTNGYHPLWMVILVAAGAPLKLIGIQSPIIYAGMFIAVSCLLWVLILAHLEGWAIVLGAILGLYCGLGMEAPLAALFLILIFDRILNDKPASVWVYLMVASRVDMAIVLLPLLFLTRIKRKSQIIVAALLAEGTVALFNWVIAGHPYSISALIKSGGAALGPLAIAAENFSSAGNVYRYAVVIAANIALFHLIRENARARKPNDARLCLALVITANMFLLAHTFLSSTRHWYFAPSLLPLLYLWSKSILQSKNLQSSSNLPKYGSASLAGMAGIGAILFVAYLVVNWNDMLSSNKFFNEVRQVIPAGNAVYAEDGAGYAAWMLNGDLKVIDGDGLVNSFEYLKNTRRTCDMKSYFRENNIKYYLLDSSGGDACPVACYCLKEGQYHRLIASSSSRRFVSYRIFEMTPEASRNN